MKQPHLLHVETNSQKLKVDRNFLLGHGQKWVCPIKSMN